MKTFEACWDGYTQKGMKKKGERSVPNCVPEDVPGNAVAQGGVNMAPNMGPKMKAINVTDRRRRKDKQPVMLKRFRTHAEY